MRTVKGLGDIKGSPLISKREQWARAFIPRGEDAEMGLCLQTPFHLPGGIQQLQGCGKTHNQVRMLRRSSPCSHCTLSPEALAHPRAGRWGGHLLLIKAQHQGGADRMVSLVLGAAIPPAHCVPAGWTHPPVFDTLHLPEQLQRFLQELRSEKNCSQRVELLGLEGSQHSNC